MTETQGKEALKVYTLPSVGVRLTREERRKLTRVNVFENPDSRKVVLLAEFKHSSGLLVVGYRLRQSLRAIPVELPDRYFNHIRAKLHEAGFETALVDIPKPFTYFTDHFNDMASGGPLNFNPTDDDEDDIDE
jgi:hypothetical protein